MSLRNRLILFAAACLLPLLVVIAAILAEAADAGREQVLDAQAATSEVVASVLAATLADNQKVLQELASIDRVRQMEASSATEALDQFSRAHPNLYGLFLLDPQANLVASTGLDPAQFQLHSAFAAAVDRSLNLGEPGVSTALTADDETRVIALTMPVRARDEAEGEPIGAVGSLLSVERLGAAVTPFARGETLIAVVAEGQVVATQGADPAVAALASSTVPPLSMSSPGTLSYVDETGMERFAVYTPVPGSSWGVLVTHPSPAAYAANRAMISRSVAAVAAAALVTLALGALAAELLARPWRELNTQAEALAAGDYTPREPIEGGGADIAAIGAALGTVANRLRDQVHALTEARGAGAAQAEQLRDLNRRTVRLQEDERRRIAGDIHDAVSPLITGALYQARALRLGTPDDLGRSAARRDSALDSISELLSKAMDEVHGVIFALRPPDLDDIGVLAAIERYIAQVQRSGLNVHLEAEEDPPALTPEVRLAIYRIVQEALHNALRHASADEAVVRFETTDETLRVTISDNGAGFNPQHAARPTALGLLSMRERAAAIGATLAVMSRPGDGTTVTIERRQEPELTTVAELPAVEEMAEMPIETAKRISA
ncbi:MAG: sensor histidine kinase [Thermomicrobiales bacterium]|jgi:signal transduction histidine kinase|nr:sensor histidine kinase [Thermomicrobiales bacterium]MDF3038900.1 sensor histidine kinase [Thermomicrobiales bacterium]